MATYQAPHHVKLGVNIDHVATIRQVRGSHEPDPVWAASAAEMAGAHGITIHLREDRRHILERDVRVLRETITTRMNLEIAATKEMFEIACKYKPDIVCLVPERREELTTEGGLDVVRLRAELTEHLRRYKDIGVPVSLFVDPVLDQINACKDVNADYIELHTGAYANAKSPFGRKKELDALVSSANHAHELGLGINAGHGLNYQNVHPIACLPHVEELNIGHSIVSRAVFVGMHQAVKEMLAAMRGS